MKVRPKVLIDTNVFVIGALDMYYNRNSAHRKIIDLALNKEVQPILTVQLLEEYKRVAFRLVDKDFSSWIIYLAVQVLDPLFILPDLCKELEPKFINEVPKEDLIHFVACIVAGADYLISENRKFIRKASKTFKCMTAEEFLNNL